MTAEPLRGGAGRTIIVKMTARQGKFVGRIMHTIAYTTTDKSVRRDALAVYCRLAKAGKEVRPLTQREKGKP